MKKNMKKLLAYVQVLALPFLLACSEDDGNYDYRELNDVTISGIEESYSLRKGIDKLEINPVITTAKNDDSKLTYEWKIQSTNSPHWNTREVIGTERNLTWVPTLSATTWDLLFRVTDTETGVVTLATTKVEITSALGSGIMIIGETPEGKSQVDFISLGADTLVQTNVMDETTGFNPNAKPVNICQTGKSSMAAATALWVMTEEDAWRFNNNDFSLVEGSSFLDNTYVIDESLVQEHFYLVDFYPHTLSTSASNLTGASRRIAVCSNGMIFKGTNGFVDPMNVVDGEKEVSYAKPFILSNTHKNTFNYFVFYDYAHERFLRGYVQDGITKRLSDKEGDPFPWNQPEGRTCQYAETTHNTDGGSTYGNSLALMHDKNNGDYYIYKLYAYSTPEKRDCYHIPGQVADLDKLGQASFYAFSSKRTALYFTIGSELYGLDYNKGREKVTLLHTFDGEITLMKRDDQKELTEDYIYVATYNATDGGTIVKFKQGTNPDQLELIEVPNGKWSGLAKVKGMAWKR